MIRPLSPNRSPMRFLRRAFLTTTLIASPLALGAQSDILLQLRSGTPLGDRYRIDSAGGFVALGQIGFGIIPASGSGWRLMWHPSKVAFRAGYADAGLQMDDANIGYYSWGGGALTKALGTYSFAMGNLTEATGAAAVALGSSTVAQGQGAISAGVGSRACGDYSVAMGFNARTGFIDASGCDPSSSDDGGVALGYQTTADGNYSTALGYRASTNGHAGAFVYGDNSISDSIEAVANNEFAVRAAGGYRFRSNATLTTGCNLPAGSGVFSCSSTRNVKRGFLDVDGEDILRRLSALPITTWQFNEESGGVRHLGPVAEDFRAAYGLGTDDKTVGLSDLSGVSLAAAKALEGRTRELAESQAELKVKVARIEELERMMARLEERMTQLEAGAGPPAGKQ